MCIMFDDTPTVLYLTNLAVGMNVLRRGFKRRQRSPQARRPLHGLCTGVSAPGARRASWFVPNLHLTNHPLKETATDNLMGGFDAYYLAHSVVL